MLDSDFEELIDGDVFNEDQLEENDEIPKTIQSMSLWMFLTCGILFISFLSSIYSIKNYVELDSGLASLRSVFSTGAVLGEIVLFLVLAINAKKINLKTGEGIIKFADTLYLVLILSIVLAGLELLSSISVFFENLAM